jgi:hypothetical protein
MDGWVFFAIGMASLATVLAALGWAGLAAYRLFKTIMRTSRRMSDEAAVLSRGAAAAGERAAALTEDGARITTGVDTVKTSFTRLSLLAQGLQEGLSPWRRVRGYFGK